MPKIYENLIIGDKDRLSDIGGFWSSTSMDGNLRAAGNGELVDINVLGKQASLGVSSNISLTGVLPDIIGLSRLSTIDAGTKIQEDRRQANIAGLRQNCCLNHFID